ncbi:hypothetical protein ACIBEA_41845 [Streptomyces sp. NPDC051555]|uniref:hypothetical protein n=1 Tax=Streptomyces sp. NPDC051555 TaxID=3365657 RepID=UPI0037A6FDA9
MVVREFYDEQQAAGRLRVSVAAWRWATGSGLVPGADAGPGRWSRAVVEAVDAERVRAALRSVGARGAADQLTQALGVPLRCRPRVTAAAVGHLVRAGLLVYLGGEPAYPDVHPDQVAALARRRDLPAVLDRHVPLGPDQAAVRLGVRRLDFDAVVGLGWVRPIGSVDVDYKRQGGVTTITLYSAEDVALLQVARPLVDWRAVRAARAGSRSPLASLTPVVPGRDWVQLGEVARMARVGRSAAVTWRRRHPDFPAPAGGTELRPLFDRAAAVGWLLAHDKIEIPVAMPSASLVLVGAGYRTVRLQLDDPHVVLADVADAEDELSGWSTDADADALGALLEGAGEFGVSVERLTAPGTSPLAVLSRVRLVESYRSGAGGLRITLAWPASMRGTAARSGGVVHHVDLPEDAAAGAGAECGCTGHDCGGVTPRWGCPDHGPAAGGAMEEHIEGGVYCADRVRALTVGTSV